MAREINVKIRVDSKDLSKADAALAQTERKVRSAFGPAPVQAFRNAVGGLTGALGVLGGALAFRQIAQFGIDLDRARNTMVALTGSVGAANAKLAELRELAKTSPGVTQGFAQQLFNQLKAVGGIADQTINTVIKSLGKLNTVFSDVGPEFARNLIQIFQQGFERSDIKEALGRVPIFEQLLEQAFGTKDPDKLRAAKNAGKLTLNAFLTGFAEAVSTDARLKNIQESLGGKLQKSFDEIKQRLGELGEQILRDLLPVLEKLVPIASEVLRIFTALPDWLKLTTLAFVAMPGKITAVASAIGTLAKSVLGLGAAASSSGFARFVAVLGGPIGGLLGGAALGLGVNEVDRRIAEIERGFTADLEKRGFRAQFGAPIPLDPKARGRLTDQRAALDVALATGVLSPEIEAALKGAGTGLPKTKDKPFLDLSNFVGGGKKGTAASKEEDLLSGLNARSREVSLDEIRTANAAERDALLRFSDLRERSEKLRQIREEAGKAQEENMTALVKEFRDQNELLREQRESRVKLTKAFEEREARAVAAIQTEARRDLQRSGRLIDAGISRGRLTSGEAELLSLAANAEAANKLREALARATDPETIANLKEEVELFDELSVAISDTERFMRGFNSQIETSGDAFERFGANVARAFGNVRDLFNGLKSAVLGFFNDLVGQSLQNIVRSVLGPIFGGGGGGGFFNNLFRTPSFAGGGGGISAPPSVSGGLASSISSIANSVPGFGGILGAAGGGARASTAASGGFNFGGLGDSLLSAAPLLGLTIGGALGGKSIAGNILGAAGGLITSTFLATTLGAPGALGSLAPALFSNPITAIVGAGLLVGSVLLGKAAQRRKDEEASGQFLTQALQGIEQLAAAVGSGQITTLAEARSIFEANILGPFQQQISGLKTKSVRESRLTNQVRDLRNVFEARIPPLIAEQERKAADAARFAAIDRRLVPQFAGSGFVPGIDRGRDSVLAMMTPGELVLNKAHQADIRAIAGPNIFERIGVPRAGSPAGAAQAFQGGGFVQASSIGRPQVVIDTVIIETDFDAEGIVRVGLRGRNGEEIVARKYESRRRRRGKA